MPDRVGQTVVAAGFVAGVALVTLLRGDRSPRHAAPVADPSSAGGVPVLGTDGRTSDVGPVEPAPVIAPVTVPGSPPPSPPRSSPYPTAPNASPLRLPVPGSDGIARNPDAGATGRLGSGAERAPVPPAPALVAVAFDDSVHIVHGPDHERIRRRRPVVRAAGTAARTASALVGVTCLAGAAVLVLDRPTVDVGQVDLAPVVADLDPAVPTATPGPTAAPTSATTTAEAAPGAPTTRERGAVTGAGHAMPDRRVDPAPVSRSPDPAPTATPTPVVDVGVSSGRVGDLPASTVAMPTRLRLPALDLDVPVVHVGQDDDGRMAVPADVDDAGWYEFGPAPGEAGNAVVAGHVDSREQGLGAFHGLVDLAVGDRIAVDADDGTTSTWEVTGRALLDKSGLDTASLFRRTGPAQLVLVTCGGNFDHAIRSYDSNLVVVATRVAA